MMLRTALLPFLTILLLGSSIVQPGTATPPDDDTNADITRMAPDTLVDAIATAVPPDDLPGNDNAAIELVAWDEFSDEPLPNARGAWVLTGSPEHPISTVIVFNSAEDAQAGIEGYKRDSASVTIGERESWTVADHGNWICITAAGPVMIIGQAAPQGDEADEEVQQRSCESVAATHDWVLDQLERDEAATSTVEATPDNQTNGE